MALPRVGPALITLDTSGVLALLNRADPDHKRARAAFDGDDGPHLLPSAILAEIGYLAMVRLGGKALDALLGDLERRVFTLDCGEEDVPRVRELVRRYDDLPLGLADAAVIACAERNGGRVLTLDTRDFGVVSKEGRITVLPT